MKPVNPFPYQCHKWPFPINFNTNERTPESQALLDEARTKRKQVRLRKTATTVLSPRQQTCALQPDLDCFTDKRSTRVDLSDIEPALM